MPKLLRALCVVYITATALHIGWIMAHEPFVFDAWNLADDTGARPFSIGRFFDYWWHEYTHSNPRLGQAFTYLAYKLEYFAVIATPLAHLALAVAIFVLGTGRLPTRKCRDLALLVIAIGFMWFAMPQIGKTLFNRAYGANYLYGAAIQLWFLVPLRLVSRRPRLDPAGSPAYFVAGVLAGLCNEHTGPTLCLATLVFAWWTHGRTQQRPTLAWAGALGAIDRLRADLLRARPGRTLRQPRRARRSRRQAAAARGDRQPRDHARPHPRRRAAARADRDRHAVSQRRRTAPRAARYSAIGLAIVASVGITATIFVSPKLGPRFYMMPMALLLAGFIGLADVVLTTPRRLAPFVALAVIASIYAATKTVGLYGRLAPASDARIAQLEASRPGSVVTVEAFEQVEDSWWFLGDDFRDIRKRELIARYFALRDVVLRGYDPDAPLGVSDVRLVPHVAVARRRRRPRDFELGWYRGLDVSTIHKAMVAAVDRLRMRGPRDARSDRAVRRRSAAAAAHHVARRPVDAGEARSVRRRRSSARARAARARSSCGARCGALADAELYIYQVGGEARRLGDAGDVRAVEDRRVLGARVPRRRVLRDRSDEAGAMTDASQRGALAWAPADRARVDRARAVHALGAGRARRLGTLELAPHHRHVVEPPARLREGNVRAQQPALRPGADAAPVHARAVARDRHADRRARLVLSARRCSCSADGRAGGAADDALLFATIFAMAVLTIPSFGMMLFYRPFTGNYLFGLVINLALVVPYRLHFESRAPLGLVVDPAAARARRGRWAVQRAHGAGVRRASRASRSSCSGGAASASCRGPIAGLVGLIAGGIAAVHRARPGHSLQRARRSTRRCSAASSSAASKATARSSWSWLLYLLPRPRVDRGRCGRALSRPAATRRPRTRRDRRARARRAVARDHADAAAVAEAGPAALPRVGRDRVRGDRGLGHRAARRASGRARSSRRWPRSCSVYAGWQCLPRYYRSHREFTERVAMLEAAPDTRSPRFRSTPSSARAGRSATIC